MSLPSQILVPSSPLSNEEIIKSVVGLDGAKDGCPQQHHHSHAQHQNLSFLVVEFEEQLQQVLLYITTSRNGIWLGWWDTMRINGKSLTGLPLEGFDYDTILGQYCELPMGYVQIPVGIAGPLLLDDREFSVSMATWLSATIGDARPSMSLAEPLVWS
ncbi:3-hydroxy-3-methyl glutaryl CoA reductase [Abeliophyllum distichum]|uniref:3-hydroxy-3-methyl glutaryl CoA reductase n=1 Tax=Abeliophyllum distichum TaxID=126358 RepID=A0ABD1SWT3_9LAMI